MGWMWASSSSASAPDKGGNPEQTQTQIQDQNSTPSKPPANKAPEHEYGDPEIAKFMAQIQTEFGGSSSSSSSSSSQSAAELVRQAAESEKNKTTPSSSWSLWGSSSSSTTQPDQQQQPSPSTHATTTPTDRLDPLSESLLPTTMSCRAAFDAAFHCNSVGGQWTSVYREGTVRSCSEHWDDFWFCMRARAYPAGAVKEDAIRAHYRAKEVRKYGGGRPSSTDVWEARPERLPAGAAFAQRYEMPDVDDEEWRRLEIERRRRVQEMLRVEKES